jgi:hypothetical protein
LTFGGGTTTPDDQLAQFARTGIPLRLQDYQNNIGLGLTVKANTTLFVKYRIGGGQTSNVGVNTINQIGTVNFNVTGPSQNINQTVIGSLRCNNVSAAIGGGDLPTTEEVRNMVTYNFAAQKRAVTINDYNSLIKTMPSKYGAPAKASITEIDNKINIQLLSYDTTGSLTESVSNTLKENVAKYLSNYRMINDYISVSSAKVIDLEIDYSVILDGAQNQGDIITNIVNTTQTYFRPTSNELGRNINISDLRRTIQDIPGVTNIADLKIFNLVGGRYSSSQTSQQYLDKETREIRLIDDTIFAEPNQIYQIRFPQNDVKVRVKNLTDVQFS